MRDSNGRLSKRTKGALGGKKVLKGGSGRDGREAEAGVGEVKEMNLKRGGECRSSRGVRETLVTKTTCDLAAFAISKESEGGKEERGEGKITTQLLWGFPPYQYQQFCCSESVSRALEVRRWI